MKMLISLIFIAQIAYALNQPNLTAPQGGIFRMSLALEPEVLHPLMLSNAFGKYVSDFVQDRLCGLDPETNQLVPRIAEKIEMAKDGMSVVFTLRKNAVFHNGDPITAEEIQFSIESILHPSHSDFNLSTQLQSIKKIEILDKYKIKINWAEKYFKNLESFCTILYIIPKSVYGNVDKSRKMLRETVGAGPYKLDIYERAQKIVVSRFDKWYGNNLKEFKGYYNFEKIIFYITANDTVLIEKIKKGDIDFAELSPDAYALTLNESFGSKAEVKKVVNQKPKAYSYIGINFRKEILKDHDVREALAYLMNREEMNKKFKDSLSDLATGPIHFTSPQASDVPPLEFNPKKAQALLRKAGWSDSNKDGVLDKVINGKKTDLRLNLIYANKNTEKYWTMYKEEAKKSGVEIIPQFLEWNSYNQQLVDKKMDLFALSRGAITSEIDPKSIWHSDSKINESNLGEYSNKDVDRWIEQARHELDVKKRNALFKKAYTQIVKDVPFIFMFTNKYDFYAKSKQVKSPTDTFKYEVGYQTWWKEQP